MPWQALIERIESGDCTPFLGAGACWPTLPLATDIAREWSKAYGYPFDDPGDLPRVSQFIGVDRRDPMYPKHKIRSLLKNLGPPDFEQPHAALAELPLSVYMTTNYDDFMVQALRRAGKEPKRGFCRWNDSPAVRAEPRALRPGIEPTPEEPLVFHLHGHLDLLQSLVLTEDDYIDFLVSVSRVSRGRRVIPEIIQERLAGSSLLFLGYRLSDWNFRVIYRGLVEQAEKGLRYPGVTVQLRPEPTPPGWEAVEQYLERHLNELKVEVFWGDANSFIAELVRRWREYKGGG